LENIFKCKKGIQLAEREKIWGFYTAKILRREGRLRKIEPGTEIASGEKGKSSCPSAHT
jgi:hypothetical protein